MVLISTTPARVKSIFLFFSTLITLSVLFHLHLLHFRHSPPEPPHSPTMIAASPRHPLSLHHLLFAIASSSSSLPNRAPYLHLWRNSISALNTTLLFLDYPLPSNAPSLNSMPPFFVFPNSSRFSSGHRIAHIVKDVCSLGIPSNTRWVVFGDDDTVFFTENLVRILSKYDHEKWYYIGSSSESYEQNEKFSFDMAYGGGGFALSVPLIRALSRVLDSCLSRYRHLYGSDARIFACLTELGVALTREPGFHQVDVRGDLFGLLSTHPLSPIVSLHHIDAVAPIFPGMSRIQALEHLFNAASADPARTLQQTVCYDRLRSLSVSLAWGYAVQLYEGNQLLPDLLSLYKTFRPWRRGKNVASTRFMFNTRELPRDPCKRPVLFFLDAVLVDTDGVWTKYSKHDSGDCLRSKAVQKLESISVFSVKLDFDGEQMKIPRRPCCDISPYFDEIMTIKIRQCNIDELIAMQK